MNHSDHVNLLRNGIDAQGGVWADLGAGTGAFTLALAELIGATGEIYSVDKDKGALRTQEREMRARFQTTVHYLQADFTKRLDLPPLDGIVMANALHFVREKDAVLGAIRGYLKPGGRLLLVEYDTDSGNMWVPHPMSYGTWEKLGQKNGFTGTRKIGSQPSRFLGSMFSSVSFKET